MAANFGVSNQVMGARQTTDFLEKFTWGLSTALVVFCLAATMTMPHSNIEASRSAIERSIIDAAATEAGNEGLTLPVVEGEATEGAEAVESTEALGTEEAGETAVTE